MWRRTLSAAASLRFAPAAADGIACFAGAMFILDSQRADPSCVSNPDPANGCFTGGRERRNDNPHSPHSPHRAGTLHWRASLVLGRGSRLRGFDPRAPKR